MTSFKPNEPYDQVFGQTPIAPGAKYFQRGVYFNHRGQPVTLNPDAEPRPPEPEPPEPIGYVVEETAAVSIADIPVRAVTPAFLRNAGIAELKRWYHEEDNRGNQRRRRVLRGLRGELTKRGVV